jgi:steroid delta-isomerase-like uncharacterized protein
MNDSKAIVQQYMDAIPRRDFSKIRQLLHPKYSYTGSDGERREGVEAGIAVVEMYTTAFPDLKLDVKNIQAVGDIVVIEFVAKGTHRGDLMGISPTNRKVTVPVCNITEVRDGKIFAEREYFDNAFMLQQLGIEVGHAHA